MDEIKFNIRSLSESNLVRRKSNDFDSKHKEKPYEKDNKKGRQKKNSPVDEAAEKTDDKTLNDDDDDKSNHVDVFI